MISIRNATADDLPAIHDLAHKIWPAAYSHILSPEQLEYMLDLIYSFTSLRHQLLDLKHNFFIVLDKNNPSGFASFSQKEMNSETYRLHKIYVLPQQHGTGTGKLLLAHVINSIKSSGGNSIELNVNRHNKVRHFYEKLGFKIIGEEDIDIGKGFFMNDFVMRLGLI
jgi:diamine N-acetyltransferase